MKYYVTTSVRFILLLSSSRCHSASWKPTIRWWNVGVVFKKLLQQFSKDCYYYDYSADWFSNGMVILGKTRIFGIV